MLITKHKVKVGDVITIDPLDDIRHVAIAEPYEKMDGDGNYQRVNNLVCIRLLPDGDSYIINTESEKGLVCFLSNDYDGCAILAIKVCQIFENSVNAIPVEFIKRMDGQKIDYVYSGYSVSLLQSALGCVELGHVIREG